MSSAKAPKAGQGDLSCRFVCLLPIAETTRFNAQELCDIIRDRYSPEDEALTFSPASQKSSEISDTAAIIAEGPDLIAVATVEHSIPGEMIFDATAPGDLRAEVTSTVAECPSHILICTINRHDSLDQALLSARRVMLVAAAIADRTPCRAVYWANSHVATLPITLSSCAKDFASGELPTRLISRIDTSITRTSEGQEIVSARSNGLTPFIGREIELERGDFDPLMVGAVLGEVVNMCLLDEFDMHYKEPFRIDGDFLISVRTPPDDDAAPIRVILHKHKIPRRKSFWGLF